MPNIYTILVIGTEYSGKTTYCNGENISSRENGEFMIDGDIVRFIDFTSPSHVRYDGVIFIYSCTSVEDIETESVRRLMRDRSVLGCPLLVFGNKDDIVSGILSQSRVESVVPPDVPAIYGSCADGKNVGLSLRTLISLIDDNRKSIMGGILRSIARLIY